MEKFFKTMSGFSLQTELLSEGEVCSLGKDGEKRAVQDRFTQIYNEYKSSIYKFCLVKLHGDNESAEDCMQNTFIVLYRKMLNGVTIEYPRAFLYRTADNLILKCTEQKIRHESKTVPLEDYEDKACDEQYRIDSDIDYALLNKKLASILNDEEQKLFKLKYIDDLTIEQVSVVLDASQTAIAKRLQRVRDKIKNSITIE